MPATFLAAHSSILAPSSLLCFLVPIVCGILTATSPPSAAGDEPASAATQSLRFRRVYVPADGLNQWPRDNVRYVPMGKGEFESLLERVRLQAAIASTNMPQAVTRARYTARLSGDSLTEGEAVLDVALPLARASTVGLAPCGLAIGEAMWLGEHPQAAVLAVGEDGQLGVRSARSGQLQLKWSLRGQAGMIGDLAFAVELPACPASQMVLVLPGRLTPVVQRAVVLKEGPVADGANRWRIELGGQHRFELRLIPSENLAPERKHNTLRQALTYEFSLRSLELSAQWTLDIPGAPLRQIAVDLDPSLQLAAARCGGQPVAWSTVGTSAPQGSTRVVLDLPEAIRGTGKVLRLGAVAMPVLGGRWRLPAMRPQGVFWQEGTATLIVPSPLTLDALTVQGGRQTQTGPLPPPQSGQVAEFEFFSSNASLEVALVRPEAPLDFDCGTALELSGVDMAAEATARFRVAEGERFRVEANVSRLWTVDSVETVPANVLEDWTLVPGDAAAGRLTIRLAKSLDAAHSLKVSVQARHHYSPLGRQLTRDDLVPIEFVGSSAGRRLVSIRAAEAYQVRVSGDERLTRVDPQSLTPADLELFDDPPTGLVFVNDSHAAAVQVALEAHKPSYSATIGVEATATDTALTESYAIRCAPESARVERMLVRFSQARSVPPRWSFGAEEQDQVTIRPWKPNGFQAAGVAAGGEGFEIAFRRPRTGPFEVRAVRTVPFVSPVSISLAALPEAARQSGTVSIGSTRLGAMQVQARHLTSIPAAPIPGDQYSTARATYRYDPMHDASLGTEAGIVLAPQPTESATPWAWAWSGHIESRYEADGIAHHLFNYRLENAGRTRILLGLPEETDTDAIRGIWVDGARVVREVVPGGEGLWLAIPLPAGRRFPVVSILVTAASRALGIVETLEPLLPQLDVPVLESDWTVWLPPGYESAQSQAPGERPWRPRKTIAQRLFGLLGQAESSSRFRPWMAEDWASWDKNRSDVIFARQQAQGLLDRLGTSEPRSAPMAKDGNPTPSMAGATWAEQFLRAAAGMELTVLVDQVALARLGVRARSAMPQFGGEMALDRAQAVVEQAGLGLLIFGDVVLVTSAKDAALYRSHLLATGLNSVWCVLPGSLSEHLMQAADIGQDPMLVSLEAWSRMPEPSGDPWVQMAPAGPGSSETMNWSAYVVELPTEGESVVLPIVHTDVLRGLGWSLFIAVFALLAWKGRVRSVLLVALATLAAVTALLIPEAFTAIPAGVLWAALAAMMLEWMLRAPQTVPGRADSTVTTQRRVALATMVRTTIAILLAASACDCSNAASGEPADASALAPAHQVLVPVDGKQQPTGDKYYVPETFFSQLQSAAASRTDDRYGWVLHSAVYRGSLSWRSAPVQPAVEELRASFDIEVFGRQVRVRIPLGRAGIEILPDGVTLEGRSIQPIWPDAEGYMAFDVVEPGRYRLELATRPTTRTVADKSVVQWKIPRFAASRLELAIPPDAPAVEFPSALGATVREPDPPRLVVALGSTDQLHITWPEGASRYGEGHALDVEQLLWLKIRPGAVVLDVLLNFRALEGRVRQVELAADPRLRYFPAKVDRSPVVQATIEPGEPQRIRLELSQPAGDRITVPATFLLQESSGVGNYRLPWFDVANARTVKRWLAVSVDPALEHAFAGERLHSIAVPAFVAAWGSVKSPPQAAWELVSPRADWNISTRPLPARVTAEQTLTVSFAARCARVLLEANIAGTGEAVFLHRIAAPPELEIERIVLWEGGVQRVSRWSRAADGTTTVFLNGPSAGRRQLTLAGRLPTPQQGHVALPAVRLEAEPAKPMEIALYREPPVQVRVNELAGLSEIEWPLADESRAPLGRVVKAFRVQASQAVKADLWIAPNRPKIRAEQVTWMRSLADAWQLDVEFRFNASGGVADQFRFEIPSNWTGPYKVQPPAAVKVVEVPGKSFRQLVVRPRTAVEGDYRLSISGPLKLGAGERPSAAKIVPEEVAVARHVLILPVRSQPPAMSWETRGLAPTRFPEDLVAQPAEREAFAAYRVMGQDYQALLREGDEVQGKPQVHLVDVRIACHADDRFHALVSFDLDPAGLAFCPVSLPLNCRLVQISVAGQSAVAAALGENQWQIPLGSIALPQRIEVLFSGQTPERTSAGLREFAVPSLGEIPVRQCVWMVAVPDGDSLRANASLTSLSPLQHALAKLRNETATVERVAAMPSVEGEALGRWYRNWAIGWLAARTAVIRQLARIETASEAVAARTEVESLEKRQAAASERLGLSGLLSEAMAARTPHDEMAAIWLSSEEGRRAVIECGAVGSPASIVVAFQPEYASHTAQRLLAALAVAVLGTVAVWGARREAIARLLLRWPYGVGVVIGVVWWGLLDPSAVGCLVAAVCVAVGAWSHWRRRAGSAMAMVRLPR